MHLLTVCYNTNTTLVSMHNIPAENCASIINYEHLHTLSIYLSDQQD